MKFIETTIHIDRWSPEPQRRQRAEELIRCPSGSVTSIYVKMEFMRSFVKALCYLNNIANQVGTFDELFPRLQRLLNRRYLLSHCIASFGNFFQRSTPEDLLAKARVYFGYRAKLALGTFDKDINLIDSTTCYLVKAQIKERKRYQLELRMKRCSRTDIRCNIVNLFKENQQAFKNIHSALSRQKNLDRQLTKMRDTIELALEDPHSVADRSNCWNCGDAIIVVEAPPDSTIVTTDKHYEILAPAAGKKLKIIR